MLKTDPVTDASSGRPLDRQTDGWLEDIVADESRPRKRSGKFDQRAPSVTPDIGDISASLERLANSRHCRDPLFEKQVLEPPSGEALHASPPIFGVFGLGNAAALLERCCELIEYAERSEQHLMGASEIHRPTLLSEHWDVLGR